MNKSSALFKMLPGMISFTDWIFPPTCVGCGKFGDVWCYECDRSVEIMSGSICIKCGYPIQFGESCAECMRHPCSSTQQRAYARYHKGIKQVVHHLKFENGIELGYHFRNILADIVTKEGWDVDAVVPVPQSSKRRKERGYNQAAMLAWPLSQTLGIAYKPESLDRVAENSTQVNQDAAGRLSNIIGSFCANENQINGRSILIIDDVITTGSTMNECARVCLNSGAKNVYGLALARSILGDIVA